MNMSVKYWVICELHPRILLLEVFFLVSSDYFVTVINCQQGLHNLVVINNNRIKKLSIFRVRSISSLMLGCHIHLNSVISMV